MENVRFEELSPDLWPAVERLFGPNGACGGCWCMFWRALSRKAWNEMKGSGAKKELKKLVQNGRALGVLALIGDEPVGWCSFGPRSDFPVLETVRAYQSSDVESVWSVICFFIHRKWRGKGLSRGLLKASVESMRGRGVKIVEGYPVTTTKDGRRLSSSFAWTGPLRIFEELGFKPAAGSDLLKPIVRLRVT